MDLQTLKQKYHYSDATQVMQQYLDIKFANFECLVLFRMGDFYELFYEDAINAAKILGIALTKRGRVGQEAIPMCGVPFHALENYLHKLLEEGLKVAICDQMETPEEAKKRGGYKAVVRREITRIITPGTLVEESLLDDQRPNYLASLVIEKEQASICYLDLSTSQILLISVSTSQLINELVKIKPSELLLAEHFRLNSLSSNIENALGIRISFQVDSFFSSNKCQKIIENYYNIASIAAIGELKSSQVSAIGSVIEYVSLTQKSNLPKLPLPRVLNSQNFMSIDSSTRRNLELVSSLNGGVKGSLFSVINHTVTKGGARLLYEYLSNPIIDIAKINQRLEVTKFFVQNIILTHVIRGVLAKTSDLERALTRVQMQRSFPRDLLSIKETISHAQQIRADFVTNVGIDLPGNIEKMISPLLGNDDIEELIEESIREDAPNIINNGEIIKVSFHPKIKELQELISNSRSFIDNLRDQYKKETGIDSLKISNNNVIGLFIDITSRHAGKIKDERFIHRQTTANSVRYTTVELQELESKIINAKVMLVELEKEIYADICQKIVDNAHKIIALATALKRLDVFTNFAYLADELNYCLPILTDDMSFEVKDGRHPVVERFLKAKNESFIKNDCNLSSQERIWLLTGPNMAGKSTFLRQNAIIAILAHIGSFVPAASAKIGVVDKIFSRVGAGDDLTRGQSTFMVEMLETSAILSQSSDRSLVILDEVGRGTSTYDGVSIAWSVLEHIHNKIKARCLFATHYHELTALSESLKALANYTVSIAEDGGSIIFLHKIIKGFADRSYGVHVAQLAGLPESVIHRANDLLHGFESGNTVHCADTSLQEVIATKQSQEAGVPVTPSEIALSFSNIPSDELYSRFQKLYDYLQRIDPNNLSPKEALELVYKLKEEC